MICVSLETSQIHGLDLGFGLCEFRDFTGPLTFIWAFYEIIWTLKHFGFCLDQFEADLV